MDPFVPRGRFLRLELFELACVRLGLGGEIRMLEERRAVPRWMSDCQS